MSHHSNRNDVNVLKRESESKLEPKDNNGSSSPSPQKLAHSPMTAYLNNPCSTCRAARKSGPCPGHGSDPEGGDEDNRKEDSTHEESIVWSPDPHWENTPIDFSDLMKFLPSVILALIGSGTHIISLPITDDAMFTVKIAGLALIFRGKPGLSEEEEKILQAFYNSIITEFETFKKIHGIRDANPETAMFRQGNTLVIVLPDETLRNQFMQHLISHNMLLLDQPEAPQNKQWPPNPFDISQGPGGIDI